MANDAYINSMRKHLAVYQAELDDLYEILLVREFDQFQYRAAERALQVSIEACIGISKHWSKALTQAPALSTHDAFEKIHQHGYISADELINWRKIIGLRNALVHDYLNVEPAIVRSVIANRYTDPLFIFAEKGLDYLSKLTSN